METLKFNKNWNGKLCCDHFTTLRLHNPDKFYKNAKFQTVTQTPSGVVRSFSQCVHVSTFLLDNIPEAIFLVDCGLRKEDAIQMIEQMYKYYKVDVHKVKWDIVVLKHIFPEKQ